MRLTIIFMSECNFFFYFSASIRETGIIDKLMVCCFVQIHVHVCMCTCLDSESHCVLFFMTFLSTAAKFWLHNLL